MTQRTVAGLIRDLGPGLRELPWRTPREALRSLPACERAAVASAQDRLQNAWLTPRPHYELHDALRALEPDDRIAVYPGAEAGGPRWSAQSLTGDAVCSEPIRGQERMHEARQYELERPDVYSNRPVALGPLIAEPPVPHADPVRYLKEIFEPNDLFHQLRMVIYEGGRAALYLGAYRTRRDRPHDLASHAKLFALRPAAREWSRTARAVGLAPLGDGALAVALSAFGEPAVLLRKGTVVFANAAARPHVDAIAAWARSDRRPDDVATVTPIAPGGVELELVLLRQLRTPLITSLSPALARVAKAASEGLADKEIAAELDLPLSTVRTYVARALRKLGLHSRRELMRAR